MLIDDAIREASRLLASLRSMRADREVVDEAELALSALEYGNPSRHTLDFVADALERIDANLPHCPWPGSCGSASATWPASSPRCRTTPRHHHLPPDLEDTTMTTITRDSLAQAAQEGTGIAHLSPGQAWATHRLAMPPERLEKPLAPHIAPLLDNVERMAARQFFASADRDDTESIIRVAHEEVHPMFLRVPMLETLRQGMVECLPGLTPSGVNDKGEAVYRLADIAAALDMPEEGLLARAEAIGLKDRMEAGPVRPLH